MIERDGSIVCQQNSKGHETKKIIIITKQIISLEAKKLIKTIESSIQKTKSKFYNLNKNCNNKEILN